jgi:membrane protein YqaA with SNARE-associated domain
MPPFSFIISGLSLLGDNFTTLAAAIGLGLMATLVFVYRATVGKSIIFVLRKLTRSKRR